MQKTLQMPIYYGFTLFVTILEKKSPQYKSVSKIKLKKI